LVKTKVGLALSRQNYKLQDEIKMSTILSLEENVLGETHQGVIGLMMCGEKHCSACEWFALVFESHERAGKKIYQPSNQTVFLTNE
jgi:hypothetical protein